MFRLFTVVLTPLYEMINPSTDNSGIRSICVSGQDRGFCSSMLGGARPEINSRSKICSNTQSLLLKMCLFELADS